MLEPEYVDTVLTAVEMLGEQVAGIHPDCWPLIVQSSHDTHEHRLAVTLATLARGAQMGRGPLLEVAMTRLTAFVDTATAHAAASVRDQAAEGVLSVLVAVAMRDSLTDADYAVLISPLTRTVSTMEADPRFVACTPPT